MLIQIHFTLLQISSSDFFCLSLFFFFIFVLHFARLQIISPDCFAYPCFSFYLCFAFCTTSNNLARLFCLSQLIWGIHWGSNCPVHYRLTSSSSEINIWSGKTFSSCKTSCLTKSLINRKWCHTKSLISQIWWVPKSLRDVFLHLVCQVLLWCREHGKKDYMVPSFNLHSCIANKKGIWIKVCPLSEKIEV